MKEKNLDLQSRREFFKKTVKKTLPVIGAIVLTSSPILAHAEQRGVPDCYCNGNCRQTCENKCIGCEGSCEGGCDTTCRGYCDTGCYQSCEGGSRPLG